MNENTERTGPLPLPMPSSPAIQKRVAQKRLVQLRVSGVDSQAVRLKMRFTTR